jgi:hypothetical protein
LARPITYTPERQAKIIDHVLTQVSAGRGLSRVLAEDEGMCNYVTFWEWVWKDEELANKVARARADGVEALLDECLEIADNGTNDFVEKTREDGTTYEEVNRDHIQRSRLRVDTRMKMAQMLKPKTYGPKLDLTSDGESLNLAAKLEAAKRREIERLRLEDKS